MKLAVFGDLHLSRESPRYEHALHVLDVAIKDARAQGAEHFAFLGDIFEGKPEPGEYRDFIGTMMDLASGGRVMIVRGNHEDYEAYSFFEGLSPMIVVAWETFEVVDFEDTRVLLIPYPTRHRAPFANLEDGTIAGSMHAAANRIGEQVAAAAQETDGLIVLGHMTIEGMTTRDTEFEQHHSNEVVVPIAAFQAAALTIVGHIHRAQEVVPGKILGAGDLYRTSFAELADPKSYVLITLDRGARHYEFRPTIAREMVEIDVQVTEIPAFLDKILHDAKGREIKIIVHMDEEEAHRYNPAIFAPVEAVAALVTIERDVKPKQRVRAPHVTVSMNLDDQLAAWLRATDQSLDPDRLSRLLVKVEALTR